MGVLMNICALLANGGRMPVLGLQERQGPLHKPATDAKLAFLIDRIPWGNDLISIGDIVLFLGFSGILIQRACLLVVFS